MVGKIAIVTGATSFIGSGLIEKLVANKVKVYALCRKTSKMMWRLPNNPLVIPVDYKLSELDKVEIPEKCDIFYHLAWSTAEKNDFYLQNLNVKYSLDAVHLAKKLGCIKLIFAGSQAEYGLANVPLDEHTPTFPVTGYGMAKLCAGQMCRAESKKIGIDFIWTRILSVYGENDNSNTLHSYLMRCFKDGITPELTSCEQVWDYIHIDQCSEILWRLSNIDSCDKIYVIGSGEQRILKEFVLEMCDEFAPNSEIIFGEKKQSNDTPTFLASKEKFCGFELGF